MAERFIVFFGLISHISHDDDYAFKTHAALVNGDEHPHIAYVIVGEGGGETHPVETSQLRILVGGNIKMARAASTDTGFANHVPHLSFVSDGQLKGDVGSGTSTEATVYLPYPGGRLATHSLHPIQAEFRQGKRRITQAVANTTVLVFDDEGQEVHVRDGDRPPILVRDQCILIANVPPGGGPHRHFHKHGDLTDGRVGRPVPSGTHDKRPTQSVPCEWIDRVIDRLIETSPAQESSGKNDEQPHAQESSDHGERVVARSLEEFVSLHFAAVDIECSQSQWP